MRLIVSPFSLARFVMALASFKVKIGGIGLAQHLDQGAYGKKGSDLLADSSESCG